MAITTTYKAIADLDTGAARMNIVQPLATYDDSAHVFAVEIRRGSSAEELSGTTCIGYFVRADGVTIPIDGDVKGNVATVILAANCYAVAGGFALAVKLSMGNVVHTVLRATGNVSVSQTDEMASPGTGVQSFDKLVEAVEKAEGYDARITKTEKTVDTLVEQTQKIPLSIRVQNLLDNSCFVNPVNQRGFTSTKTDSVYTIDRWKTNSAHNAATISLGSGGITLEPTTEHYCGIIQQLDRYSKLAGKTVTAAVCVGGVWYAGAFTLGAAPAGGVALGNGLWIYSASSYHLMIRNLAGQSPITIQRVALYEGEYTADTLPAYVYKGYAAELAECMRYYQQSFDGKGLNVGVLIQIGTTSNCLQTVEYRVPMRIIPTVTIYSPAGTKNAVWNWQTDTDVGTNVVATYASVYGFIPVQAQTFERGIPYAFHYTASADL